MFQAARPRGWVAASEYISGTTLAVDCHVCPMRRYDLSTTAARAAQAELVENRARASVIFGIRKRPLE